MTGQENILFTSIYPITSCNAFIQHSNTDVFTKLYYCHREYTSNMPLKRTVYEK